MQNITTLSISSEALSSILKLGLDLNHIYLLLTISNGNYVALESNSKIEAWKQTLERKGYLVDGKLHSLATDLLEGIQNDSLNVNVIKKEMKAKIKEKEKQTLEGFDSWWNLFPSSDIFEYKGRKFSGGRGLKNSKDKCRVLFDEIIKEGEYTVDELNKALTLEVEKKKEQSYNTNKNNLSFMKNTHAYLFQRAFEGLIPLVRENKKQTVPTTGQFYL